MITGNSGPLTATTEPNEMKHVGEESLENKQTEMQVGLDPKIRLLR